MKQLRTECSLPKTLQHLAWYRIARPAIALSMWALVAQYFRWCIVNANPEEFSLEAFMPSLAAIGTIAVTLMTWSLSRHINQSRQRTVRQIRRVAPVSEDPAADIFKTVENGRRLVAYHDEDGLILQVTPMREMVHA